MSSASWWSRITKQNPSEPYESETITDDGSQKKTILGVEDPNDLDMDLIIFECNESMREKLKLVVDHAHLVEEVKSQRTRRRALQNQMQTEIDQLNGRLQALEKDLTTRFGTADVATIFRKQAKMTNKIKSLTGQLEFARKRQEAPPDNRLEETEKECSKLRDELCALRSTHDDLHSNIRRVCESLLGRPEDDSGSMVDFLETRIAEMNHERHELTRMKECVEDFCGRKFESVGEMEKSLEDFKMEFRDMSSPLIPVEDDDEPVRKKDVSKSPSQELFAIRTIMQKFLSDRCRASNRQFFNEDTPFYLQFKSKLKTINLTEDWAGNLIKELKSERDELLSVLNDCGGGVSLNSQFKTPKEIAEKLNDMKTNGIAQCFDVFEDELEEKTDADAAEFVFHLISEYYDFTIKRKHKLFEDLRDNYCASNIQTDFLVGGLSRVIRDCYEPKDEEFLNERGDRFGELLEKMRDGGLLSEIVKECGELSFLVVWSRNPQLVLYPIANEETECCGKKFDPNKHEELFSTRKLNAEDCVQRVVFPGLFDANDYRKEMPSSSICVFVAEE